VAAMTDLIGNLWLGLGVATELNNLLFAFIGCLLGTLIGVLPGIGPIATIALLLPITFELEPLSGLVMLAGIYYGAQYGGSTTSILVNLPGEASSVVTCLDGHQMARNGRAGAALSIAALGSFFAGCVATLAIALFSAPLSKVGLSFRPEDYCSLMLFGLVASIILSSGSPVKAIGMVLLGLTLGIVGTDVNTGELRFTLGLSHLQDGIDFVSIAMGIFGIAEIAINLERAGGTRTLAGKIERLMPTRTDLRRALMPMLRGTAIGTALGVLPGGGAMLSSFSSYALEKKLSRRPEEFGQGAVEGVAGPESANNAGAQTSFIPLLTLGIPGNALIALLVGAMLVHGIAPGPQVMEQQPKLYWGLIASMWVGNLMLVIINLPLIRIWVSLLSVPYRLLFPCILLFVAVGAYGINNSTFDVLTVAVFGVIGYVFIKLNCEPAPLMLGFILGPLMEENFRRALLLSRGDWSVFVTSPISLGFLVLTFALGVVLASPLLRRARGDAFIDG